MLLKGKQVVDIGVYISFQENQEMTYFGAINIFIIYIRLIYVTFKIYLYKSQNSFKEILYQI